MVWTMITTSRLLAKLLTSKGMTLADLARLTDVNPSSVTRWNDRYVPVDRLLAVEQVTGISRVDLRPDLAALFPPKPSKRAANSEAVA